MKNITADNYQDYYWWLDTEFNYGDFEVKKFALYCMVLDEDGCIDHDTEERILWAAYEDVPGYMEAWDDGDRMLEALDAYIMDQLGFVPDYDIN